MNKGAIAAVVTIILAVVVIGIVVLIAGRRPRVVTPAAAPANKWSFLGSIAGAVSNLGVASWKAGSGTAPVSGSQVVPNAAMNYGMALPSTTIGGWGTPYAQGMTPGYVGGGAMGSLGGYSDPFAGQPLATTAVPRSADDLAAYQASGD